jgi:single-strand DNA-binding protein|nr:MAG TPA: Single strand binding protein [Caudoviricetes sp.]
MNSVNLIGRLTAEPEVRYTQQSNVMVTQFNLAVNRAYVKPEDEQKADFITILAWNKTAEFVSKYFKKGQQVGVTGRIETGSYDDKDGKRVYTTKVVAEHVYFADSKKENMGDPFATEQTSNSGFKVTDDDLPF